MKHSLTFVTAVASSAQALDALLLSSTLRRFGGTLANAPLWMFLPAGEQLPVHGLEALNRLQVRVELFSQEDAWRRFPFAAKVQAAAAAERIARRHTRLLAWLDPDTVVLNEPAAYLLPTGIQLGYRPVHHRLIGPDWETPRDRFWQLIDLHCQVPAEHLFPMTTHVGEPIQPYFNAGSFVVRPERGLLGAWWRRFESALRQGRFQSFFDENARYAIFLHQAVLTGVLLHALKPAEMRALHPWINYPLHLHNDLSPALRPPRIDDLTTARHEELFNAAEWRDQLPFSPGLADWLAAQPRLNRRA